MRIVVMSRAQASRFFMNMTSIEKSHYACISICGLNDDPPLKTHYPKKSLFMTFDDIDQVCLDWMSEVPMQPWDADEIAGFVKTIANVFLIDTLIVHCEAGMSRSAGVAAAIMKWLNNDDTPIFDVPRYRPNMRCYRMTLNALMDETTGPMPEAFVREAVLRIMSRPEWNVKDFKILHVASDIKLCDRHLLTFNCHYTWQLNAWDKNTESTFGVVKIYKTNKYEASLFGMTRMEEISEDVVKDIFDHISANENTKEA